jgi:hypothetical protein
MIRSDAPYGPYAIGCPLAAALSRILEMLLIGGRCSAADDAIIE